MVFTAVADGVAVVSGEKVMLVLILARMQVVVASLLRFIHGDCANGAAVVARQAWCW